MGAVLQEYVDFEYVTNTLFEFYQKTLRKDNAVMALTTENYKQYIPILRVSSTVDTPKENIMHDAVLKPVEQSYTGSYNAIKRTGKRLVIKVHNVEKTLSADRLKPAKNVQQIDDLLVELHKKRGGTILRKGKVKLFEPS
uniref:Uncharacterized protein n=1 Tax=Glossina austeni TaxID=7395 RepID=A0A1A9V5Q9_GLOAU